MPISLQIKEVGTFVAQSKTIAQDAGKQELKIFSSPVI